MASTDTSTKPASVRTRRMWSGSARPKGPGAPFETVYDLIGYSRGGLLLRTLAELRSSAGPLARRFKLGQAVLVAVPNGGTPLATGARWENTLGLVANITDALPDNRGRWPRTSWRAGSCGSRVMPAPICRAWPRWMATARS